MNKNLKIVVVGPGAIGGTCAAFIAKNGYDVTLVANRDETRDLINSKGIKVSGKLGELTQVIKSVSKVNDLTEKYDIALIATKAYVLKEVASKLLPYLKDDSIVVSMQNGICTDILAEIVGEKRTVGCVIGFGASMIKRGHLEVTSDGEFVIGGINADIKYELSDLKEILETCFPVRISSNMYADLYSKLIVNSCITSLGAICGLKLGQMMKRLDARRIFLSIIDEAMEVAKKANIKVPPYGGKLDYYKLTAKKGLKRHIIIMVVGIKYKKLKSSSLQSLERGEMTEINYFNGYISRLAKQYNVATPINDKIVAMVHDIEEKKLPISVSNFKSFN